MSDEPTDTSNRAADEIMGALGLPDAAQWFRLLERRRENPKAVLAALLKAFDVMTKAAGVHLLTCLAIDVGEQFECAVAAPQDTELYVTMLEALVRGRGTAAQAVRRMSAPAANERPL